MRGIVFPARRARQLAQEVRARRDALNRDLAQLESAPDASSPEIRSRIERVMGELDQDVESLRFFVIEQRQEADITA